MDRVFVKYKKNIKKSALQQQQMFELYLKHLLLDKVVLWVVIGMVVSFFYNLPVIKYSVKGDNEFRLYDVLGVLLFYHYYKYSYLINLTIKKIPVFNYLKYLLIWIIFGLVLTLFFSVVNSKITFFFQVFLYYYHFCVFYLGAIFLYLICIHPKRRKLFIQLILVLSILSNIVVVLQNMNVIPFLWSKSYWDAYAFYSGTLGPNKIVLGMTALFVLILSIGIALQNELKVNKLILFLSLISNLYIVLLSGSRTSYVALGVFLAYFALRSTIRFVALGSIVGCIFFIVISFNSDLYDKLDDTLSNRVVAKMNNIEQERRGEFNELYEKLGSGRDRLTNGNIMYLIENPQIIPFGMGFVNRFTTAPGLSAHNMYLQVIKELGLVGFVLYFGWLIQYLFLKFKEKKGFSIALKGLVIAMLVTLYFGEHLYIYRPLFGILGLFLAITSIFASVLHRVNTNLNEKI